MKKILVLTVCGTLLLAGCGSYAGAGAYTGSTLGSILGSAIGGIAGGPRGSDIGTIIGMAGGAVVGGAIGSAADQRRQERIEDRYEQRHQQRQQQRQEQRDDSRYDDSRYDDGGYYGPTEGQSYDDRIYDFGSTDYTGTYSASPARTMNPASSSYDMGDYAYNPQIEIRNPRFVDDNHDNILRSNELSKVIFEVVNTSSRTLYDLQPTVVEASGNKRIYISPSVHVESLAPGAAIRYTAMVKAGKIKDGTATFCLSVLQGGQAMSGVTEFSITTRK